MLMKSKRRVVSVGNNAKNSDGSFTLKEGDSNFRQIQNDKFHTGWYCYILIDYRDIVACFRLLIQWPDSLIRKFGVLVY
jgi:hypothetical protein